MESLIDDDATLRPLCTRISEAPLVALDTEFIRERTYFPQLCLLQLATEEVTACVDCLADLDLAPLFAALGRPDIVWVLHSGRQDLEVIRQRADLLPARLIDTQIAASLTGHAAQSGLREVLASVLGVDIGKGYTRTDWSRRPLPEGPLQYALDDVRYLLPLWHRLEEELGALGRLDWLAEDSARLLQDAARDDLLPIWGRLRAVQQMTEEEQAAALVLVRWREQTAKTLDRPRRWIMSDELLVRLAQLRPTSVSLLAQVPDMPRGLAQKHGALLVETLALRNGPEVMAELRQVLQPERPDKDALKALQARVKARAAELGVDSEVLASRRDLIACLVGMPPEHLRSGWRAAQIEPLLPPP